MKSAKNLNKMSFGINIDTKPFADHRHLPKSSLIEYSKTFCVPSNEERYEKGSTLDSAYEIPVNYTHFDPNNRLVTNNSLESHNLSMGNRIITGM
jgi:hypothetical protein